MRAQVFSILFLSVCTSLSSFVIHIFFFDPPLYICFGLLPFKSIVSP